MIKSIWNKTDPVQPRTGADRAARIPDSCGADTNDYTGELALGLLICCLLFALLLINVLVAR